MLTLKTTEMVSQNEHDFQKSWISKFNFQEILLTMHPNEYVIRIQTARLFLHISIDAM